MKTTTIYSAFTALALASLLSSCAFLQKGEFAQRKYYDFPRGKHTVTETATVKTKKQDLPENQAVLANIEQVEKKSAEPVVSASVNKKAVITSRTKNQPAKHNIATAPVSVEEAAPVVHFKKSDIRKQAKKLAERSMYSEGAATLFIMVLAAIFIPPLAIFLKDHRTNKWFWITMLLCILGSGLFLFINGPLSGPMMLFWVVAVIIALLDVFDKLG